MSTSEAGQELCVRAAKLRQQWQEEANLGKAEDLFRQAVREFPNLWMAHFGLGELLLLNAARSQVKSGPECDEGLEELQKAVGLDPRQPEPLLKLANKLAATDTDTAERYYTKALQALESPSDSLYPTDWQAADHFQFAIGAAEDNRHTIAVDAFCRAIQMNEDYAGKYMPSPDKANADWQSALEKLGKTEWFEQREERDNMLQNILSGKPLDSEPQAKQEKGGCLGMVLVLICVVVVAWFFLK